VVYFASTAAGIEFFLILRPLGDKIGADSSGSAR
jgi:hypothetical protein